MTRRRKLRGDPAVGPQNPPHCGTQYPDLAGPGEHTLSIFLISFGTIMTAIITVLAVSPSGTLEIPATYVSCQAGTVLGTVFGEPGLVCLQRSRREKRSRHLEMVVLERQLCALSEGLTFVLPVHRFHSIETTNRRWKILEKLLQRGISVYLSGIVPI